MKLLRILSIGLFALVFLLVLAFYYRTPLFLLAASLQGAPEFIEKSDIELGENEAWVDDYFTVEQIDSQTYAISESRYALDTYFYLLIGTERALLIDSGSPHRDLTPIVSSLTNKPVTVIATHLHFDHVGNHNRFDGVLMPDIVDLRARAAQNKFSPTRHEYMGFIEGFERPQWDVVQWWTPGEMLDLGGRKVKFIHTPGHTPDSIFVWDEESKRAYMGDHGGDGKIYAFLPNSSLNDYLESTARIVETLPSESLFYAGHGGEHTRGTPVTDMQKLIELRDGFSDLRDDKLTSDGFWPRSYPISEDTMILTDWRGPGGKSWDFP